VAALDWDTLKAPVVVPEEYPTPPPVDSGESSADAGHTQVEGERVETTTTTDDKSALSSAVKGTFDVVVASDFICRKEDCLGSCKVLLTFLKPGGRFLRVWVCVVVVVCPTESLPAVASGTGYLVVSSSRSRYGVEFLVPTLKGIVGITCLVVGTVA